MSAHYERADFILISSDLPFSFSFSTKNSPFLIRNGLFLVENVPFGRKVTSKFLKISHISSLIDDQIMQKHNPIVERLSFRKILSLLLDFLLISIDFTLIFFDCHRFSSDFRCFSTIFDDFQEGSAQFGQLLGS